VKNTGIFKFEDCFNHKMMRQYLKPGSKSGPGPDRIKKYQDLTGSASLVPTPSSISNTVF
jgi:hypothetical protein